MKYAVWTLILLLIVLHQDVWYWDDAALVFGFLPVGLLYHVGISIAAAISWYLATLYCWPEPDDAPIAGSEAFRPDPTATGDER